MSIRVLVTDCHELLLQSIKVLLEKESNIEIIDITDDGYECLNIINKKKPDILLISNEINSISGFDVINIIKEQNINIKYIGMADYNERKDILQMYRLGFHGILPKTCAYNDVVNILNDVYKGYICISDKLHNIINEEISIEQSKRQLINSLTKREYDILVLLSTGKYNGEIASLLNISERTVKNHLYSIYKKINVSDRTQAAIFAIHNIV